MIMKCKKCHMNDDCGCEPSFDECDIRLQSYNKAINDFRKAVNKRLHSAFSDDLEIQKYVDEVASQLTT